MSELISHVTDSSFKTDVLESPRPVLVDFFAVWCGPYRAIASHLEALSTELGDTVRIVKVNVDENTQAVTNFGIRSIPTLLMFRDGKVVDQMVGNPGSRAKLKEFITHSLGLSSTPDVQVVEPVPPPAGVRVLPCSACLGSRKTTCSSGCRGSGQKERWTSSGSMEMVACLVCGGSGKIACGVCGGTGVVSLPQ